MTEARRYLAICYACLKDSENALEQLEIAQKILVKKSNIIQAVNLEKEIYHILEASRPREDSFL